MTVIVKKLLGFVSQQLLQIKAGNVLSIGLLAVLALLAITNKHPNK